MGNQVFESEHKINYYECNANQQLTISMLVNIMMQASGEHSQELGVGDDDLAEKGLAWIVLQYAIDIKQIPTARQKIKVSTQALSYKIVEDKMTENEYRVRYLDIDTNLHVNNSKYLDWAIDTLDYEFLTTHKLTHLNIKFEKEVYYGNQIKSQMSLFENEEGELISAHRIMTGDVVNSEASMTWEKRL